MAKKKKDEDKLNFDSTINDILNGSYNSSSSSSSKSKNIYSSDYAYNSAADSADDIINKILSNDSKTKSNYDDNVINPNIDVNHLIDSVLQEANALEQYSIMKQKENEKRAKAEAAKRAREDYYKENKDTIINNRTSDLIYNWNMENTPVTSWDYKDISSDSLKDRLGIKDLQVKTFLSTDENEKYNNLRNNYAKQRDYFNNSFARPEYGPQNQNHYQLRSYEPFSEERAEELIKREKSSYERDISNFNEALNSGKVKAAQNAIQRINTRYFGADYSDGIWASIGDSITGNDDRDISQLMNRFNTNINKLSTINDSIKNTTDIKTLANLNAERDKLELENQLIQYNRLLYIESNKSTIDSINALTARMEQPFKNIDWSDIDDTNILTKVGSYLNKGIQTLGATANFALEGSFGSLNMLVTDDMDEGVARNITGTVVDTATYLIPYVGQARLGMTITKDTSVAVPYLMNFTGMEEESALLGKTPTGWNALGAVLDVAAVYTSEKIFSGIRGRFGIDQQVNFHLQTGKDILKTMAIESTSEAAEEFFQTYAEHMMYNDEFGFSDLSDRQIFTEAIQSAGAAFVLTAGLSATSGLINNTKNNVLNDNMLVRTDTTDSYKGLATQKNLDTQKLPSFRSDKDLYDYVTTKLKNNEIVSLISPNNLDYKMSNIDIKTGDVSLDTTKSNIKAGSDIMVSDAYSKNNTAAVLVPSHEMSTYIKGLNPNANIIVADTSSKNFSKSLQSVLKYTAATNIAPIDTTKKLPDKSVVEQKVIKDLNKVSNELRTEAIKVTESLPTKNTIEQTASTELNKVATETKTKAIEAKETKKVIQDILVPGDYNNSPLEIANKIKTETAKEVKQYSEGSKKFQEQYLKYAKKVNESLGLDSPDNRAYIRTVDGNTVIFNKTGDNTYEATNTVNGEGNLLANVKSNGKIINGNLDIPVGLTKHAVRSLNTMIDTLDMNGNYLTEQSTGKDVSKLISQNKDMGGEILQTLGYDAIMSGTNKLKLTTAHDNLDNFNLEKALENANESINQIMNEVKTDDSEALVIKNVNKSNTATFDDFTNSQVEVKPKDMMKVDKNGNIDIGDGKTIDVEYYTPEYNAIIDNTTFGKKPKDKKALKFTFNNMQALITDWYAPIMQHVKHKGTVVDHDVLVALDNTYNVDSVYRNHVKYGQRSFDGQTETGKSVEAIFDQLKGNNKKETKANNNKFQEMMYLYLHEERLRHGAEGIYEGVPGDVAVKRANDILNDNPKFKLVMDDIKQLNSNSLDYLLDAGLINAVQYSDLKNKYQYYIPIYSNNPSDFVELGTNEWFNKAKQHNTLKETTLASLNIENLQDAIKSKLYMEIKAGYKNKLMQSIANSTNGADIKAKATDKTTKKASFNYSDNGTIKSVEMDYTIPDIVYRGASGNESLHPGITYFIDNKHTASSYGRVEEAAIQMKNPFVIDADGDAYFEVSINKNPHAREFLNDSDIKDGLFDYNTLVSYQDLIDSGYDGLVVKNVIDNYSVAPKKLRVDEKGTDSVYVSFSENQITNPANKKTKVADKNTTEIESNAYSGNTGQLIYFDNGEVKQFMTTKEIAESVDGGYRSTNIDKAFNLPVLKQFKWLNQRVKSRMLTGWDPMFQAANLIRDYLDTAFINTNYNPASFTKNYLRAFGNVARGSQMYYDFASTGIVDLGPKNSIHRLVHNFEAMPKFAEYLTALDAGKSRQDAIIEARSANINMHRGGSLVKQLNSNGVIFLNMAVQGADKAVGSGIRLVRGANTPKGFAKLVTILGAAAAPGVINSLLNEDDEEYQKLPYYLKNNYFFIKLSDGQFARIPKGRVTAFVDTLFRYASGISSENTPKDYVDSINDVVKNSILPIEISGSFPLYSEYQGLIGNETFTGGEIWSENDSEEVKREKQFKYFVQNYTGRFGKTLIAAADDNASTDVYSSINNFHFDSTRYNKNLSTVYDLKSYYENKDNVKTFEDQIKKKYIDTQMSNLNQNIRATINKGRDAGLTVQELRPWYQASDAITNDIIRNINNYVVDINGDGSYTIYFDDLVFDYKLNKHGEWKFTKRK